MLNQKLERERRKDAPSSPLEYWTYICPISKLIYMEISQLSKWSMPLNYDRQAQKALKIFTYVFSLEKHT